MHSSAPAGESHILSAEIPDRSPGTLIHPRTHRDRSAPQVPQASPVLQDPLVPQASLAPRALLDQPALSRLHTALSKLPDLQCRRLPVLPRSGRQ